MFWRWLTTGGAALLGFSGAALLDCTYSFMSFIDMFDLCVEADLAVPGGSVAVGTVLVIGAVALLGYTWIPYSFDVHKEHEGLEETGKALVENVHRLPHEASGPVENLLHAADDQPLDEEMIVMEHPSTSDTPAEPEPATVGTPPVQEEPKENLLRRVELMETLLREERVAPGQVAKHWIELLREANELHRDRKIDGATFEAANTRLLALYVSPEDDAYSARHKVGSGIIS